MKQGVYALRNRVTGEHYVGATVAISKRYHGHIGRLTRDNHQNKKLQAAWNLYGNVFDLVILEECPRSQHRDREKHWISVLDSCSSGYNSTPLGAGPDPETRRKISETNKRRGPEGYRAMVESSRTPEGRAVRAENMRRLNKRIRNERS